jgi:tRNA(Ile)-lysidine synthase
MKDKINRILSSEFNVSKSDRLLIACSGGMDSMVLSSILHELEYDIILAHVNYNLRGKDSILDKELVEEFANERSIPIYVYNVHLNVQLKNNPTNLQAEARRIRYDFFEKVSDTKEIDYVITAHHLDDQLETLLFNLSRKMHLGNLAGIPNQRNNIIRPLLQFSKNEIKDYCTKNDIKYREDMSNFENKYTRNKLRNNVITALTEQIPNFHEGFEGSINNFNSGLAFYEDALRNWKLKVSHKKEDSLIIKTKDLLKSPDPYYLLYTILAPLGFKSDLCRQIFENACKESTGRTHEIKDFKILINRKEIICVPNHSASKENSIKWELNSKEIHFKFSRLSYEILEDWGKPLSLPKEEALFDRAKINFPLTVRTLLPGDRIKPFGLNGKQKKVKKVFTDLKINRFEKGKIPIILDAKGEIIWIPGFCHSSIAQISPETQKVLHLKIKKETT